MEQIYQQMQFHLLEIIYKKKLVKNIYLEDPLNYSGKKAKNAQEAHEAIRPTDIIRTPQSS